MFGKKKPDGIVEAVRYAPDGQIEWVRMFLRRGPTYSDWVLVRRKELVEMLKAGKTILVGERIPLLASTFKTGEAVRLLEVNGQEVVVAGVAAAEKDELAGVPLV